MGLAFQPFMRRLSLFDRLPMLVALALSWGTGCVRGDGDPPLLAQPLGHHRWTIMIYGGVNSSAEEHLIGHLESLKAATREGQFGEIILLMDRVAGYTADASVLGEDFEDTRIYRLNRGDWERIGGGEAFPEIGPNQAFEANTGDAHTLAKFVRACKEQFPAKRYALILFGHGESRSI